VNQYAALTDAELHELSEVTYRGTIRLFTAASEIFTSMSQVASWTPEYESMQRTAGTLMAAGREQSELGSDVTAEMRERRAEAARQERAAFATAMGRTEQELDALAAGWNSGSCA
jgi:hypothetical protein